MGRKGTGTSGAGSHAGRGFRYQDAVGVWLALRCWNNELHYGLVIPEGRDDYELQSSTDSALVQVKSRRDHLGLFSVNDIASFVRALWDRYEASPYSINDLILILERPVTQGPITDYVLTEHTALINVLQQDVRWESLASRTHVWIIAGPSENAIETLSHTISCAPMAAQVYYGELLNHIGILADANGMVKSGKYEGLAISDVETIIRRIEPLLDIAGMETALCDGYCDAVDFLTSTDDPAFYQGVDTRPGHLAAGLVTERPEARSAVLVALEAKRAALIVGPSGAGKSALMWEVARASRHTIRWFEITRGDACDAHLYVRLARALRASSIAPVGFIFDDVGKGKTDLWDSLIREAGAGNGILLLGSIREEDIFMSTTRPLAREIRLTVEDTVAERIWQQLSTQNNTTWTGWREPWAQSGGLLLEYTHILTRGERLEIILGDQVDCRLREGRDAELAILRITALVGAAGAAIEVGRLPDILELSQGDLSRALRRLINEHLIAEPQNGQLSGLHQLRSEILLDLCHRFPPPTLMHTVSDAVRTVQNVDLGSLIAYVIIHYPNVKAALIAAIVDRIELECDPIALVAALSGLGKVHIETTLHNWLPEAQVLGLEPTQVTFAVMLSVTDSACSSTLFPERIRNSAQMLRTRSAFDPRLTLISSLSEMAIERVISASAISSLQGLLGTLLGIDVPLHICRIIAAAKPNFDALDLTVIADLLGAARLIDPNIAVTWAGRHIPERLIARIPFEIPWSGPVDIEMAPEGRLLRSSIFHVAHSIQTDINEEVVQLCTLLLGLDPTAEVVAVDAVVAGGFLSGVPDYPLASKRISRENLPPAVLPDWNKQWITTAARLIGTGSYTEYLQHSRTLLNELVPLIEKILDDFLRNKSPSATVLDRIGAVHNASRALTPPINGEIIGVAVELHTTSVQNILFCCSAELIRRFYALPEGFGLFISWLQGLLKDIEKAKNYPWELIGGYPEKPFIRLKELITSLRLLSAEAGVQGQRPTQLWLTEARSAGRGGALSCAVRAVERQFNKLASSYLDEVNIRLKRADLELELYARPDWDEPLPWPTLEFLGIVDLEHPVDWLVWLSKYGDSILPAIGEGRRIWIIPRISGIVVSRLTVHWILSFFASPYVIDDWLNELNLHRLNDRLTQAAQTALDLIIELDGFRYFALGIKDRPPLEQVVRQEYEKALATALFEFEQVAKGTAVQMSLRHLSEESMAGHLALSEGSVALLHGNLTTGGEALLELQHALLMQDITTARIEA